MFGEPPTLVGGVHRILPLLTQEARYENDREGSVNRRAIFLGLTAGTLCSGIGLWNFAGSRASSTPFSREPTTTPHRAGHHDRVVHYDVLAKLLADDRRSKQGADWARELASDGERAPLQTQAHPLLGKLVPDFSLVDLQEQPWNLYSHLRNGPVVLLFYLGNACPACLHELVEVNADIERFHGLGAEVAAISGDAPARTRRHMHEFGALSFPVLSDPGHTVARAYGALRSSPKAASDEPMHAVLVVSRTGQLTWMRAGDAPLRNNAALLYELARLEQKLPGDGSSLSQSPERIEP
jgi:peroxiredoxin